MHLELSELHLPPTKAPAHAPRLSASRPDVAPDFASTVSPAEPVARAVTVKSPTLDETAESDTFITAPSFIGTTAERVGRAATNLENHLGQWWETTLTCAQNTATNAGRLLGNLGQGAGQGLATQVSAISQKTSQALIPIEQVASQGLSEAGQASLDQLTRIAHAGQTWVSETFPTPREFVQGFGERVKDTAAYAYGWLQQRFWALVDCIPESVYYPQKWPPKNNYKLSED